VGPLRIRRRSPIDRGWETRSGLGQGKVGNRRGCEVASGGRHGRCHGVVSWAASWSLQVLCSRLDCHQLPFRSAGADPAAPAISKAKNLSNAGVGFGKVSLFLEGTKGADLCRAPTNLHQGLGLRTDFGPRAHEDDRDLMKRLKKHACEKENRRPISALACTSKDLHDGWLFLWRLSNECPRDCSRF
jgi:hypothetical protein